MRAKSVLPVLVLAGATLLSLPLAAATSALPDFTGLVKAYGPAVVNISTTQGGGTLDSPHGFSVPDLPEDSPLQEFFRRFFDEGGEIPEEQPESRSLGSGFFVSEDGYVLTNTHVIEGADEVVVRTSDRREFVAEVVGTDKRSDIALIKIDAQGLPAVRIGTAKDLQVGEWVLAIGSPFGFEHSATAGIVSAKGRSLPSENYVPFIQTDVAINPGNSGGPLFNLDGEVVGVNSQIYSRTGGFMGLSFAIPIDMAMDVVEQLKTKGRVTRGWLGVLIQDVTRELAETFGMDRPRGALIAQVLPDSPAERAGLQVGDVILAFNGTSVTTSSSLPPLVGASPLEEPAKVEVLRGGDRRTIEVVIGELPEEAELAAAKRTPEPPAESANRLGLVLRDLGPQEREQLGLDGGVLVDRVEGGPAERAGIRAGDLILMFDNQRVADVAALERLVEGAEAGRSVAVLVQRGDGRMFFAIRVPEK